MQVAHTTAPAVQHKNPRPIMHGRSCLHKWRQRRWGRHPQHGAAQRRHRVGRSPCCWVQALLRHLATPLLLLASSTLQEVGIAVVAGLNPLALMQQCCKALEAGGQLLLLAARALLVPAEEQVCMGAVRVCMVFVGVHRQGVGQVLRAVDGAIQVKMTF